MSGSGTSPGRVLILDDEPDTLFLLRIVLERRGFEVHATDAGEEALRLLEQMPFDVALVDLLMPGMSGRQFISRLRRLPESRRPAVLVVSALQASALERELAGAAPFAVVSKPFELGEIESRVAEAAASRSGRDAP